MNYSKINPPFFFLILRKSALSVNRARILLSSYPAPPFLFILN